MRQAFREVLVAVAGLTPQVITETLYYLTQKCHPPIAISEIHVLTTELGKQRLLTTLLTPGVGRFYTLCVEYDIDPTRLAFDATHVHVLRDAAGAPLEDIRTAADSAAIADQILLFIRRLTADPTTRLFCSLAGGRKTQSVLLGFALQLYGRDQDVLLHVLVSEELEGHVDFFYPPKQPYLLQARNGRQVDAHAARVEVAEIPYLRLRTKLFGRDHDATTGFDQAIVQAQQRLDALSHLPALVIMPSNRRIAIDTTEIRLEPLEIVVYAWLAKAKVQQTGSGTGFLSLDELDNMRHELLQHYESLYGRYSGHVENLVKAWEQRLPPERLRAIRAKINRKIRQAVLDSTQAEFYVVSSERRYGATRYGLLLPPELIELQE